MATFNSKCGCRCDADDPPPCDPQPIRISSTNGCYGSITAAGSLPVRVTVTNPLGVVVYDGQPPDNGFDDITDTMLGVYTWTATALGCATNFNINPSGSVTVRCKGVPTPPFGLPYAYIWPGATKKPDTLCPCFHLAACGIKVEGGRTLTWYGGSAGLAPYPATVDNWYPLVYPSPLLGIPAIQEGNCWAGVQRYDGACCVLPAGVDPWLPGAPFLTCPQGGNSVDLLWIFSPNLSAGCEVHCYAMFGSLNPLDRDARWPVATSISQAGTSIEIPGSGGMRVYFGLAMVGLFGPNFAVDPPPEFEPTFAQFSGGVLTPASFRPPDPRIFGYASSGYGYGPGACQPYPPFPVTVTD